MGSKVNHWKKIVGIGMSALVPSLASSMTWAAAMKTGAESLEWKSGKTPFSCEDKIGNLFLAGSFLMPGRGDPMNLWVGKPRGAGESDHEIWGLLSKASTTGCEAQCKVTRFERFQKDLKPALMELECEGSALHAMRMPLHIEWARAEKGFETRLRMGSSLYGVEEAPLTVAVNRYEVAPMSGRVEAVSAIKKRNFKQ